MQEEKQSNHLPPFIWFDRNNEYMHCFGDAMGRLYEYCVDGAKLIGSSGKYNGIFMGQAYYDMLMVRHPADAFPMHTAMPEYDWGRHPFLAQASGVAPPAVVCPA